MVQKAHSLWKQYRPEHVSTILLFSEKVKELEKSRTQAYI
jgi:hypothetical protein